MFAYKGNILDVRTTGPDIEELPVITVFSQTKKHNGEKHNPHDLY